MTDLQNTQSSKPLIVLFVTLNPESSLQSHSLFNQNQETYTLRYARGIENTGLDTKDDAPPPDIILLDCMKSDQGDLEALKDLIHAAPQLPVIVITAEENESFSAEALRCGAQDYLVESHIDHQALTRATRYAIERKESEEKLLHTESKLQQAQKMESIGQLAGGIAHDFNNILTSILGHAHLLRDTLEPNDERFENIDEILISSNRAAKLVQQLLTFSRKQVMPLEALDVNRVVGNMLNFMHRTLGEDIELLTSLHPEECWIKGDPHQMEQILLNLAVNSRDAMPVGGKLQITTSLLYLDDMMATSHEVAKPGWHVVLSVRDTGEGIPPEYINRVFEPFFTTKEVDKGTGLGLATVYGIVKQFDGQVHIYSEPNEGTEFKFYFPITHEKAPPKPARVKTETRGGDETILVVEDEIALRILLGKYLTKMGYNVLSASNGEEALELVDAEKPKIDMVISDVVMPKLSGPDMVKQLRNQLEPFEVLYISGFTQDKIDQHGLSEGEHHLIIKPYTREQICSTVRSILD